MFRFCCFSHGNYDLDKTIQAWVVELHRWCQASCSPHLSSFECLKVLFELENSSVAAQCGVQSPFIRKWRPLRREASIVPATKHALSDCACIARQYHVFRDTSSQSPVLCLVILSPTRYHPGQRLLGGGTPPHIHFVLHPSVRHLRTSTSSFHVGRHTHRTALSTNFFLPFPLEGGLPSHLECEPVLVVFRLGDMSSVGKMHLQHHTIEASLSVMEIFDGKPPSSPVKQGAVDLSRLCVF